MKDKYANGINYQDFLNEHYSKEQIDGFKATANYLCMISDLRREHKITQKQLEELSGIKQPMIARIEDGDTIPRVNTLLRLLEPMGLTLKIVPIEKNMKE